VYLYGPLGIVVTMISQCPAALSGAMFLPPPPDHALKSTRVWTTIANRIWSWFGVWDLTGSLAVEVDPNGLPQGWVPEAKVAAPLVLHVYMDFFPNPVGCVGADRAFAGCRALNGELLGFSQGQVLLSSACYRGRSEA
jgi:hypothetical protein